MELGVSHEQNLSSSTPVVDNIFDTYHKNLVPIRSLSDHDTYEKALKNTLLNKFAIETLNNKLQEVTLQDGSKELGYLPGTIMDYGSMHG